MTTTSATDGVTPPETPPTQDTVAREDHERQINELKSSLDRQIAELRASIGSKDSLIEELEARLEDTGKADEEPPPAVTTKLSDLRARRAAEEAAKQFAERELSVAKREAALELSLPLDSIPGDNPKEVTAFVAGVKAVRSAQGEPPKSEPNEPPPVTDRSRTTPAGSTRGGSAGFRDLLNSKMNRS